MLEMWVHTPPAQAIGAALLHSVWQAAVAAVVLAGALYLVRPASARARHDAACAMLLAIGAAFSVTLAACYPRVSGNALQDAAAAGSSGALAALAAATPEGSWGAALTALAPWLAPWWMAGVLLLNVRRLVAWVGVRRLRTAGAVAAPDPWSRRLADLAGRFGVSAPVTLLESGRIESPVVLGLFKPVILVPIGMLTSTPAAHVELVLLHELAHIRRRDYAVNLLRGLAESLFFYHPAVWWISSVIAEEREHCCDDLVVEVSGDAREYAAALVGLETLRSAPEPALGASGGSLLRRVRRLLRGEPVPRTAPAAAATAALLTVGLALFGWQTAGFAAPQDEQLSSYEKWLQQDVVYIIEDAEKTAFLALSSDAERDRFIEQFWERRNPAPGATPNKFKEEHYRRIAYMNSRYSTMGGVAGWTTDRGRIYIQVGPPDEVESHPSGGGRLADELGPAIPYDIWRYWTDGGTTSYTFADRNRDGLYQLIQR